MEPGARVDELAKNRPGADFHIFFKGLTKTGFDNKDALI